VGHFDIIHDVEGTYREEVVSLWSAYLPGTSKERYRWMAEGNPAGPCDWFVARDVKKGAVAGVISVMPRTFRKGGVERRAGILGDFMVKDEYRVFGPSLALVRRVQEQHAELGYDLLYTIPNEAAEKLIQRVGLRHKVNLKHYARPLSSVYYLEKGMPALLARGAGFIVDPWLGRIAKDGRVRGTGRVSVERQVDERFDELWSAVQDQTGVATGVLRSDYVRWRFLQHPEQSFSLLTCTGEGGRLQGYLVYSQEEPSLSIHTLLVKDERTFYTLMKNVRRVGLDEGKRVIYMRVNEGYPWVHLLKRCLFFDAQDDIPVLYAAGEDLEFENVCFLSGDRNL